MKDLVVGQVLGRYELLVPIAKGGMAQVWAARLRGTRGFQKIVAVKTILPGSMDDERMEEMFLEEATLASQIHHPNVVGTLELGEEEGMLYLVMEWVEGESLNFIMNRAAGRGGIPLPIAVNLIGQACKGLHAAHDLRDESGNLLGLVHRDISAQNVLVSYAGNAKLVDFGIAKATARASGLTEAGEIKGKFAYLAPEQARSQTVDRRTDVFSMGILLYYLTTRSHPFKGTSPGETLQKICTLGATPPSRLVADFPPDLEAVIVKAMQKDPEARWPTANDMLSALERAMPEAMDGSFEVRIADYLGELLGNRARERRTELRLAQQMLDGSGAKRPGQMGSTGSLRAISVSGRPATQEAPRQQQITVDLGARAAVVERNQDHPLKKTWGRAAIAVSAAVAIAGAVKILGKSASDPAGAASSVSAASPVPAVSPTAIPTPSVADSPPAASVAPPAALNPGASDAKDAAKHGKKAAPAPAAPRASATNPPSPAPAAEKPRTETRDAASNAWDPGSFGGRR